MKHTLGKMISDSALKTAIDFGPDIFRSVRTESLTDCAQSIEGLLGRVLIYHGDSIRASSQKNSVMVAESEAKLLATSVALHAIAQLLKKNPQFGTVLIVEQRHAALAESLLIHSAALATRKEETL